ncbi:hypothetical protein J5N97_012231 [Dioscorea zingiberensis]|uniref:Protein kinase G11A n=1 Tax=Dioscorea zingiberensis TaxID=325984 RepID=A0A9D5HHW7_9LILI|nr:hypothetical protein J5N97_012231 [Dioscorea zingiberensis]
MNSSCGTSEIVEAKEELNLVHSSNGSCLPGFKPKAVQRDGKAYVYPVEDDLSRLIEAIDLKTTKRVLAPSCRVGVDLLRESRMKKPMNVGLSQASGMGASGSVTIKQALRRLCISQASEMAAIKRMSKPIGLSGVSEAGTITKLYSSVVVQGSESGLPINKEKGTVEVSLYPEKIVINSSGKASEICEVGAGESSDKKENFYSQSTVPNAATGVKTGIRGTNVSASKKIGSTIRGSVKVENLKKKAHPKGSLSTSHTLAESAKTSANPRIIKPIFGKKVLSRKKGKRGPASTLENSSRCSEGSKVIVSNKSEPKCQMEPALPSSGIANGVESDSMRKKDKDESKLDLSPDVSDGSRTVSLKMSGFSGSREKGECSQSSKSSMADYSSSASISDESNQSGYCGHSSRPHMSKDVKWMALHNVIKQQGNLGLKNFKLHKRLGCGDIGTVYLAELIGSECLFALKVMDNEFLMSRKKMLRAQTEREILQMLDHPFLPTLYAHFTSDNLSCLVMEYCPGGDLHVLRQKQPGRSFSELAARFYIAEVLLALEYLHMLGVIYRDLKPENILVREDGHIMLSDFDLSLRCTVNPTLLRSSSFGAQEQPLKKLSGPCSESSCISPLCMQPSWVQTSCFTTPIVSSTKCKTRKPKPDRPVQVSPFLQLVVEPTDARSNSFVGTHEYLAPEIIRGDGHGSAVDWWTFGIFLYELLFGRTPFKGSGNEETLANVVSQSLVFPESPPVSSNAKDLIIGLLVKEPAERLGSVKGAAEIKQHPFFEDLNWALIRSSAPPETPKFCDLRTPVRVRKKKESKCLDFGLSGEDVEFELF